MLKNVRELRVRDVLPPHIAVLVGIVAVMSVTFALIINTLDRGFDWTDEGFVWAMIASNRVSTSEYWGFQYLLNPLYELLGSSVLAFRVLRLLGYVVLGLVLTLLARALLRTLGMDLGRFGWVLVGLFAQIGTFAAWSYPPRYLGYNELSSWLTQLAAALLIFLLLESRTTHDARAPGRWWVWLITGALLPALVLTKISAGVFLSLLALVAAFLVVGGGAWWKRVGGLLSGAIAAVMLMLVTGVPLQAFVATTIRLVADQSAQAASGYSITTLLTTYLGSMAVTVGALAFPILFTGIILLVVRGFHIEPGPTARFVKSAENVTLFFGFILATVLIAASVFPGALDNWASLGVSNTFLLALSLLVFAVLGASASRTPDASQRRNTVVLAFALILFALAPLISALGTNTRIFPHTVFSATIWAVGAAVGLVLLWQRSAAISAAVRLLPVLLLGAIVASFGLAVVSDVFVHPYRTAPYFNQNSIVLVGDLRGIRLTEDEAELFTWLHDAGLRQDAQGTPSLSIATPGALLAFNANDWSAIWPGPSWALSIAQSCAETVPKDLIVLQSSSEIEGSADHDQLVEGLDACGIEFPTDFQVVEHHTSDDPVQDVRVWRLE
jgi:hypothetical protein